MKFQVPQFIEVEDKIFGPFTFRQFVYLIGGAGLDYVIYRATKIWISIPLIFIVSSFALALAFYKVNNRSFLNMIESAFYYFISPKLFLWRREEKAPVIKNPLEPTKSTAPLYVPKLSSGKLNDLTWSLDIQENLKKEKDYQQDLNR